MNLKGLILSFVILALLRWPVFSEDLPESDQQISEFSLSGFGEKGKKSWDLSGKSADIFTEVVKLKSVIGNLYGQQEDIRLSADSGDFNKTNGLVHLEDNVVITTTTGTRLTTDSLNWDRKNQLVTTEDKVNIKKENLVTTGTGALGQMALKQVSLKKDVCVDILPQDEAGKPADVKEKTVITCDGPLEIDYEKNTATFNNNVLVKRPDSEIYSDKMDVYFIPSSSEAAPVQDNKAGSNNSGLMGTKIDKIIARGNVKVKRGDNTSFSQEATYTASDKKLVLTGRPQLILYSTEGLDAFTGD